MHQVEGLTDGLLGEVRCDALAEAHEDRVVHGDLGLDVVLEDPDAADDAAVAIARDEDEVLRGVLDAEGIGKLDVGAHDLVEGLGLDEHRVLDDSAHGRSLGVRRLG